MGFLSALARTIDCINEWTGRITAWLILGAVIVCFLVATLRYGFSIGYPWMQELYIWQHAVAFMLGAGYTMLHNRHVSVDILTGRFTERTRAWLDIVSTFLFLFPWLAVLAIYSAPFILSSWSVRESSFNADGLAGLYLFKTVIWIFCALLFLQGVSLVAHRILFLTGHDKPPAHPAPASA